MLGRNILAVDVSFAVIVSLGLMLPSHAVAGKFHGGAFKDSAEMRVSSPPMHCDYSLEDPRRAFYNFEYPKLLLLNDGDPIVAFVDARSERLLLTQVSKGGARVRTSVTRFGKYMWDKWPVTFVEGNEIFLAIKVETPPEKKGEYHVRVFLLDADNSQLSLQRESKFRIGGRPVDLSGLFPYKGGYLVVGRVTIPHFRPLGLLTGHSPSFRKNISFILDDEEAIERTSIEEEEGWFSARYPQYVVTESARVLSAWVRSTSGAGYSAKHEEGVYFSESRDGKTWSPPVELHSVKGVDSYRMWNVSLVASRDSAFILWQDAEKGFFVAEIRDGGKRDMTQISDMKRVRTDPPYFDPFSGAPTAKIAADRQGNVYALWVWNSDRGPSEYQLFLSARVNDTWRPPVVISRGRGIATLPDMQVDKRGVIHIAYVGRRPQEQYACYYLKVEGVR
ncbi:MAG: hypothetical protein WC713_05495 [Candidatus Methylomirabilota bacterium]